MRWKFVIVLTIVACFGWDAFPQALSGGTFDFNQVQMTKYAKGIIESFSESGRRKDVRLELLNFTSPALSAAVDGSQRRFVYVAFRAQQGEGGFEVVFEVCEPVAEAWTDVVPVVYSPVASISDALRAFETVRLNPKAHYPSGCGGN